MGFQKYLNARGRCKVYEKLKKNLQARQLPSSCTYIYLYFLFCIIIRNIDTVAQQNFRFIPDWSLQFFCATSPPTLKLPVNYAFFLDLTGLAGSNALLARLTWKFHPSCMTRHHWLIN